jgi:hypothetical protein
MTEETFVEVGFHQAKKAGQGAEGDVFLSRKTEDGRIISVLSDGLGSGIKAGVLATLTATMALKFIAEEIPIRRAASIIMKTLPVCKVRRISYATFTIVDIDNSNAVKIIEYDNPPYVLVRDRTQIEPIKTNVEVTRSAGRRKRSGEELPDLVKKATMHYSEFDARPGDRLVFFSDGVPQSGMGTRAKPIGWGNPAVQSFILNLVAEHPGISARELARRIVSEAEANDAYQTKDDVTCGVVYFRRPRKLLVLTGPSVDKERDREMAETFLKFPGKRVVCGGTTANILARELGKTISVSLKDIDPHMPPASAMDGADLVTEGIITLSRVAELLERPSPAPERGRPSPAARIVDLLLDSDQIDFIIGTKINEAHQDPSMPVELEIRRNIVKRIAGLLEEKHLKETRLRFI